jgi:hypothetical protein
MTTQLTPANSDANVTANSPNAFAVEYVNNPRLPVLLIDEHRFGSDDGFAQGEERIVWAGVLTTAGELVAYSLGMIQARQEGLDDQKRGRAIKSADVLEERLGGRLRPLVELILVNASVEFWASSNTFLVNEWRARTTPHAVLQTGQVINGPESPVIDMMSGYAAERTPSIQAARRIDAVIDRCKQNGLFDPAGQWMLVSTEGAPATQKGKPIRLGAGIERRMFGAGPLTGFFGDMLLIPDLCARLWSLHPRAVDRLRGPQLLTNIERIGGKNDEAAPGMRLVEELERALGPRKK